MPLHPESVSENNRLLESARVLLANVSGGTWDFQGPEWKEAAAKWRDEYQAHMRAVDRAVPSELDSTDPAAAEEDLDDEDRAEIAAEGDRRKERMAHMATLNFGRSMQDVAKLTAWMLDNAPGQLDVDAPTVDSVIRLLEDADRTRAQLVKQVRDYAAEVENLGAWIARAVPGERSRNEGAIDTAIRVLGSLWTRVLEARELITATRNFAPEDYLAWEESADRWLDMVGRPTDGLDAFRVGGEGIFREILARAWAHGVDVTTGAPDDFKRRAIELYREMLVPHIMRQVGYQHRPRYEEIRVQAEKLVELARRAL